MARGFPKCQSAAGDEGKQFPAKVVAILGMQWGDEGKGKLVDVLAQQYEFVCRGQVSMTWECFDIVQGRGDFNCVKNVPYLQSMRQPPL